MSVVNKMLNDLEKRENEAVSQQANYQPPSTNSATPWLWLAIGLLLVAVIAFIVYLGVRDHRDINGTSAAIKPIAQTRQQTAPREVNTESLETNLNRSETQLIPNVERDAQPAPSNVQVPAQASQVVPVEDMAAVAETIQPEPQSVASRFLVSNAANTESLPRYQVLVTDALAQNQTERALTLLLQWVASEPQNIAARKKLAALYFSSNKLADAEITLQQAREIAPNDASVRLMQSRLFTQLSKPDRAWQVLQLNSQNTELLNYRAALAREQNRLAEAWQDYYALTQLDPLNLRAWLGLGVVSENLQKSTDAINAYTNVVALSSGNIDILTFAQQRLASLKEPG